MRKGTHFTPEQLKRLSDAHKGIKPTAKQLQALDYGRALAIEMNYIDGRSANPDYRNKQKNQWSKRHRTARGSFTHEEWEEMKAKCDWKCLCCGRREPEIILTPDHIIPLSKDGTNDKENRQPLCRQCNLKKHTKTTRY